MKMLTTIRPLNYLDAYKGLIDYIEIVNKTKYDSINFNFKYLYRNSNDFETIEEYTKNIKDECDLKGISIPVTHGYYLNEFQLNDLNIRDNLYKKISECLKLSKLVGAKLMVVHAGVYLDNDGYNEENTITSGSEFFTNVCKEASKYGLKIAIENDVNFNRTNKGKIVEPSVQVISKICDNINDNLREQVAGICYDVGHANLAKRDILNDLIEIKENLFTLHLHNNEGLNNRDDVWKNDLHNPLVSGKIDIKTILNMLEEFKFSHDVVIESNYRGNDEKELIETMNKDFDFCNKTR